MRYLFYGVINDCDSSFAVRKKEVYVSNCNLKPEEENI